MGKLQKREGLPESIKNAKRFFEMRDTEKDATPQGWNNPDTWKTLNEIPAYKPFGFVAGTGSNYLFIDGDHVIKDGVMLPEAKKAFNRILNNGLTYWEYSVSGTGIHLICDLGKYAEKYDPINNDSNHIIYWIPKDQYEKLDGEAKKALPKIELFYHVNGRYCYFTGNNTEVVEVATDETASAIFKECLQMVDETQQGGSKRIDWESVGAKFNEVDGDTARKIMDALNYIDPDDYPVWIKVGQALQNIGMPFEVWDEWSQKSTKYGDGNEKYGTGYKWGSFRRTDSNWNAGTIFKLAKQGGWNAKEPEKETDEPKKPDNVAEYLKSSFAADVEKYKKSCTVKTGFRNLDAVQEMSPGLYVIGAISSLGKTTFIHQMMDQMALDGTPVIMFSFEQSKLELASKGLARCIARSGAYYKEHLTSTQIRKGISNEHLEKAMRLYEQIGKNEYIVEGNFETTMKDIEDYIKDFLDEHEEKPVVIIDYLQIIQPTDPRQGTKEYMDAHVRALKIMQLKYDLIVIAISSLNRTNYYLPVDYESFKETGAIEYSANVIWGLQLSCLNDELYDKANRIVEKRKKASEAMKQDPREIELVNLKNRFGKSRYKCMFAYCPEDDYFFPIDDIRPVLNEEEDKAVQKFDTTSKDLPKSEPRTVI